MTAAGPHGGAAPAARAAAHRAILLLIVASSGCTGTDAEAARRLTGGEPERGREVIRRSGCAACHTIDGVSGANGLVGPPLDGVAQRAYIGGVLTNTPDNLVRWIRDPKSVDPLTAMPSLGLTEAEARDAAAYLYSLR